jgi:hypothetical protein
VRVVVGEEIRGKSMPLLAGLITVGNWNDSSNEQEEDGGSAD